MPALLISVDAAKRSWTDSDHRGAFVNFEISATALRLYAVGAALLAGGLRQRLSRQ